MKTMLLGLAAAGTMFSLCAAPASARDGNADGRRSYAMQGDRHDPGRDFDHHHRRGRGDTSGDFVPWSWSDGDWAYYNNRSFSADSYNDWWHDRPDRAFPRWVRNNQNCERVWWSGAGWRC